MFILPSLWPVLIGAVVSMVLGMGWYGVFSKPWMKATGVVPKGQKPGVENMWAQVLSSFASYLLMAFAVGMLVLSIGVASVQDLLVFSVVAWAGYMIPNILAGIVWEGKGKDLLWINGGFMLVALIIDGLLVYAFDIM